MAVNAFDTPEQVQKYIDQGKFTFRVVLGGKGQQDYALGKAYGVQAYPTNYLVDAETGKILWRSVGFNETGLRAALQEAGVK